MTPEEQLEKFVDNHNLRYVLEEIAHICHEKADHIQSNWQDKNLAKSWTRDANRIERILHYLEN